METKRLALILAMVVMALSCAFNLTAGDADDSNQPFDMKKFKWGPRIGLDMTKTAPKLFGEPLADSRLRAGLRVGAGVELRLMRGLYLNADAYYTDKGFSCRSDDFSMTASTWLIEVPVYLSINIKRFGDFLFRLNTGFSWTYGINGTIHRSDVAESYGSFDEFAIDDFLLHIGAKVCYRHFVLDLDYDFGIIDMGGSSGLNYKNRSIALTVGYNF